MTHRTEAWEKKPAKRYLSAGPCSLLDIFSFWWVALPRSALAATLFLLFLRAVGPIGKSLMGGASVKKAAKKSRNSVGEVVADALIFIAEGIGAWRGWMLVTDGCRPAGGVHARSAFPGTDCSRPRPELDRLGPERELIGLYR